MNLVEFLRCSASIAALVILGGCANFDRKTERHRYLQFVDGAEILLETDEPRSARVDCEILISQVVQKDASLKTRYRCAEKQTTDLLPYSFRARVMRRTSDGKIEPSIPFLARARTSVLCQAGLVVAKALNREILENNCSPNVISDDRAASAPEKRYLSMSFNGRRYLHAAVQSEKQCLEHLTDLKFLKHADIARNNAVLECTSENADAELRYRATLLDKTAGLRIVIATPTDELCRRFVAGLEELAAEDADAPQGACAEIR